MTTTTTTTTTRHWTERSIEDFAYSVASDFIDLLRDEMDKLGLSKSELAKAANVSKGRITQIFKNPGNLEMITMAKIVKALKMKMAVFPYKDVDDPNNERGPINSEVFRLCWEKAERPADMWAVEAVQTKKAVTLDPVYTNANRTMWMDLFLREQFGIVARTNVTGGTSVRTGITGDLKYIPSLEGTHG